LRLLNRSTRSVSPTEAGIRLLARLNPAMREIADALTEVSSLQDVPAGILRLTVPRPAARLLLAPMLAQFAASYPRIQVEVVTDDGLVDVVGQGFDAGIRFGESLAKDMIAVPIGQPQRFAVVASPGFLGKKGIPILPRDLAAYDCICRRFPSGNQYAWEFSKDGNDVSIAVHGPLVLDDDEVMVRAALDGAGLAYAYEEHVRDAIAAGRLVSVLDDWCQSRARFFLYYPSRRQLPRALKAFVDAIRADVSSG
jgi:DNA-binding transcriptional LysR family regulator